MTKVSYYPIFCYIKRYVSLTNKRIEDFKNGHIKGLSYYPVSYYPGGSVIKFASIYKFVASLLRQAIERPHNRGISVV